MKFLTMKKLIIITACAAAATASAVLLLTCQQLTYSNEKSMNKKSFAQTQKWPSILGGEW
jgi:cobalamin synthase